MPSALRLYRESYESREAAASLLGAVPGPAALLAFPREVFNVPRSWAARKFEGLQRFTEHATGGHFAAIEETEALLNDFVSFVEDVEGGVVGGS